MIRRHVVMPVTAETLWQALTDPEQVAGWFGADVEWDLRAGGAATFRGHDGEDRDGRIEAVRPGRLLRFTWWPVDDPDDASEVSYVLEPATDGTRLAVQERRLEDQATVSDSMHWSTWDGRLAGAWGDVSMRASTGARA